MSTYLLFPLRRVTAPYDKLRCALAAAGLKTKRLLAPRRPRRLSHAVTSTVTTTVWVVDGVHNDAANGRAYAHMALTASFADLDILVLLVAEAAEAGVAF
jgi:hypothetical protein